MKKPRKPRKVVDETTQVRCVVGKGIIREEVWQDWRRAVVTYNPAFINHALCAEESGRVLGSDNSHTAITITPERKRSSALSAMRSFCDAS